MKDKNPYTLAAIEQQRAKVRAELHRCESRIARQWEVLVTPPPETTVVQKYVNKAEKAYAIYDGVMLGYKLCKRFNGFAHLFRKKKKGK